MEINKGKVFYNKLIRDGVPSKITRNGGEYEIRKIQDTSEFQQELLKKVSEEAKGLAHSRTRDEFLQEYADLMVVLDSLTKEMELSEADIKTAIEENMEKKGGFNDRVFLHWSTDDTHKSNETPQGIKS